MPTDWFAQNAPAAAPSGGDWFSANAPGSGRAVSAEDFLPQRSVAAPGSLQDFVGQGLAAALPGGQSFGPEALGRFAAGAGEMLNPVTLVKSLYGAVTHPVETLKGVVGAQVAQGRQAAADVTAGRYSEAAGHGLASIVPLLGPAAASAGEQVGSGDVAGGLGKGFGLVAPVGIGAVAPKALKVPALARADPAAADALALADRSGVPVDAATASGNKFVKAIQHVSDRSLAGSMVAGNAERAQTAGLATLGEQLAAKASERAVTAGEAGSAAQKGVGGVVSTQRGLANDAYDRLRAIEAIRDPMPVDLSGVKAAMQPIADRLAAKKAVVGTLMGKEGTAAAALDALLKGPDTAPLSVADSALSQLKAMARTNNPDLRSAGQGIAAKAVGELHQAVSNAAEQAGPDAVSALADGRQATIAKYAAADVLKKLTGVQGTKSPTTAFRGMTQGGDTSIGHLSDTLKQAPETKPLIARAVLDGLINSPTAGAAKTWTDWQKLGPDTKQALYTPEHIKDLDAFFKLRKMMAENPNPSGTAHTVLAAMHGGIVYANPAVGAAALIGPGILSTLLHSPAGVRLLTRGMRIPIKNTAASSAWATDFAAATSQTGAQPSPVGAPGR